MDKTVVITGGAGGMGLATAKIMGHNHHVVLSDVNEGALADAITELKAAGVDAEVVVSDITSRASVASLLAQAGGIAPVRAVVHTAGVSPQMGSAEKIIRINATGTVNVVEAAYAIAGEGFAVVTVASLAGHMLPAVLRPKRTFKIGTTDAALFERKLTALASRVPHRQRPGLAYALSKGFVIWYSRTQAARFGAKWARIVSVSPGSFDTAMGRLEIKSGSDKIADQAALKRFGAPAEIAEVLAFAASEKAGYLTGTDILCDGGTQAGFSRRALLAAMARD